MTATVLDCSHGWVAIAQMASGKHECPARSGQLKPRFHKKVEDRH